MRVRTAVKAPQIVGVIAAAADLRAAARPTDRPDIFELRLDALVHGLDAAERFARQTRLPLIITARHPAEGGLHALNAKARNKLLERFLPHASYIDVELRSLRHMRNVAGLAKRLIISVHDFRGTPSVARLREFFRHAQSGGADIFKIATRTDTPAELSRLIEFASATTKTPVAAMGVGKLGAVSRLVFARCGSPLVYAATSRAVVPGQMTVAQLRAAFRLLDLS